eukprot:1694018-Pleurochrysis_carterae.AAC.3
MHLGRMRTKRCVVSLQEVSMFQGLEATRMPKSAATVAFQYLTTFVREAGPGNADGLWGARSSQFVLHATRPILLSELLEAACPALRCLLILASCQLVIWSSCGW